MASRPGRVGVPYGDLAAATFKEIGAAEGITEKGAHMAYTSALRKLRGRRTELLVLLELSRELDSNRIADVDYELGTMPLKL